MAENKEELMSLLEKEMATHSGILAWKNPMDGGTWLGYSLWGRKESDMTERLHFNQDLFCGLFCDLHGENPIYI